MKKNNFHKLFSLDVDVTHPIIQKVKSITTIIYLLFIFFISGSLHRFLVRQFDLFLTPFVFIALCILGHMLIKFIVGKIGYIFFTESDWKRIFGMKIILDGVELNEGSYLKKEMKKLQEELDWYFIDLKRILQVDDVVRIFFISATQKTLEVKKGPETLIADRIVFTISNVKRIEMHPKVNPEHVRTPFNGFDFIDSEKYLIFSAMYDDFPARDCVEYIMKIYVSDLELKIDRV